MKKSGLPCLPLIVILNTSSQRHHQDIHKGDGNDTTIIYTLGKPKIKPLPVVYKEEYDAGNVMPGDHTQHMLDLSYCESTLTGYTWRRMFVISGTGTGCSTMASGEVF